MSAGESNPVGRLRWRCRRGTKELDQILGGFLENDYAQASQPLQRAFAALLECQDPDIQDWLAGAGVPQDPRFRPLLELLRNSSKLPRSTFPK